MDALSELAPNYTPYRYGFNNPVFWQDATGLFESYDAAEEYRKSNRLFGASIDFDADANVWRILDGERTITQIGNIINTMYMMDGEVYLEQTNVGGGAGNGGESNSKKERDPGYNPFGFVFTTKDGKDSPVTPSKGPRDAKFIDASIIEFFTDLFGPEMALGYEYDYKKKKKKKEKSQTYYYDSYMAVPASTRNIFLLRPIERSVHMTPSEFHSTDWNKERILDSIQAVEIIKNHEPSRIHFEESIKNR